MSDESEESLLLESELESESDESESESDELESESLELESESLSSEELSAAAACWAANIFGSS